MELSSIISGNIYKREKRSNPQIFVISNKPIPYFPIERYTTPILNNYLNMPKANSAFMKPMTVSSDLAAVVGKGPMPRSEVVKALWVYIKKNNLQDPTNKRNINADENLQKVFGGKKTVNMFEMTKLVSPHLS